MGMYLSRRCRNASVGGPGLNFRTFVNVLIVTWYILPASSFSAHESTWTWRSWEMALQNAVLLWTTLEKFQLVLHPKVQKGDPRTWVRTS
ncbi:hypothetical protein BDW67DRAFT_82290 [Aspergillus spinulosporus]